MTTVNKAQLKLVYEDATTRTYTFSGIESSVKPNIKSKVKAINASLSAGTADDFANTFVSDSGAPCKMIGSAKLITTYQEVIYSAN